MIRHLASTVALLCSLAPALATAQVTLEKTEQGVEVKCDGALFTRYLTKSGAKPILWPIIGPTGKEMTREYPMRDVSEFEKPDHVHHRSFWFDHGDVNGISFWHENDKHGTIEHREFMKIQDGSEAVIQTRNDWKAPGGEVLCQDVRSLTFGCDGQRRWIDFDVTVTALSNEVVFGDTKEGSFGLRVAGSMREDHHKGGKIVNSEGQTNGGAWGKRAAWVDYSGPVDGEVVGIAILNHPQSFRYPTYWHVRTYGLFAANPFGLHDFLNSPDADGSLTLKKGESFRLSYRVLLHKGDATVGKIAEAFSHYADQPLGD